MNPTTVAKQQRQQEVDALREEVTRLQEVVRSLQDRRHSQDEVSLHPSSVSLSLLPSKEVLGKRSPSHASSHMIKDEKKVVSLVHRFSSRIHWLVQVTLDASAGMKDQQMPWKEYHTCFRVHYPAQGHFDVLSASQGLKWEPSVSCVTCCTAELQPSGQRWHGCGSAQISLQCFLETWQHGAVELETNRSKEKNEIQQIQGKNSPTNVITHIHTCFE